jgi:hypothetical protein
MLPAVGRKENRRGKIETILRRGCAVQGEYCKEYFGTSFAEGVTVRSNPSG